MNLNLRVFTVVFVISATLNFHHLATATSINQFHHLKPFANTQFPTNEPTAVSILISCSPTRRESSFSISYVDNGIGRLREVVVYDADTKVHQGTTAFRPCLRINIPSTITGQLQLQLQTSVLKPEDGYKLTAYIHDKLVDITTVAEDSCSVPTHVLNDDAEQFGLYVDSRLTSSFRGLQVKNVALWQQDADRMHEDFQSSWPGVSHDGGEVHHNPQLVSAAELVGFLSFENFPSVDEMNELVPTSMFRAAVAKAGIWSSVLHGLFHFCFKGLSDSTSNSPDADNISSSNRALLGELEDGHIKTTTLLGMVVGLVVAGCLVFFLAWQLWRMHKNVTAMQGMLGGVLSASSSPTAQSTLQPRIPSKNTDIMLTHMSQMEPNMFQRDGSLKPHLLLQQGQHHSGAPGMNAGYPIGPHVSVHSWQSREASPNRLVYSHSYHPDGSVMHMNTRELMSRTTGMQSSVGRQTGEPIERFPTQEPSGDFGYGHVNEDTATYNVLYDTRNSRPQYDNQLTVESMTQIPQDRQYVPMSYALQGQYQNPAGQQQQQQQQHQSQHVMPSRSLQIDERGQIAAQLSAVMGPGNPASAVSRRAALLRQGSGNSAPGSFPSAASSHALARAGTGEMMMSTRGSEANIQNTAIAAGPGHAQGHVLKVSPRDIAALQSMWESGMHDAVHNNGNAAQGQDVNARAGGAVDRAGMNAARQGSLGVEASQQAQHDPGIPSLGAESLQQQQSPGSGPGSHGGHGLISPFQMLSTIQEGDSPHISNTQPSTRPDIVAPANELKSLETLKEHESGGSQKEMSGNRDSTSSKDRDSLEKGQRSSRRGLSMMPAFASSFKSAIKAFTCMLRRDASSTGEDVAAPHQPMTAMIHNAEMQQSVDPAVFAASQKAVDMKHSPVVSKAVPVSKSANAYSVSQQQSQGLQQGSDHRYPYISGAVLLGAGLDLQRPISSAPTEGAPNLAALAVTTASISSPAPDGAAADDEDDEDDAEIQREIRDIGLSDSRQRALIANIDHGGKFPRGSLSVQSAAQSWVSRIPVHSGIGSNSPDSFNTLPPQLTHTNSEMSGTVSPGSYVAGRFSSDAEYQAAVLHANLVQQQNSLQQQQNAMQQQINVMQQQQHHQAMHMRQSARLGAGARTPMILGATGLSKSAGPKQFQPEMAYLNMQRLSSSGMSEQQQSQQPPPQQQQQQYLVAAQQAQGGWNTGVGQAPGSAAHHPAFYARYASSTWLGQGSGQPQTSSTGGAVVQNSQYMRSSYSGGSATMRPVSISPKPSTSRFSPPGAPSQQLVTHASNSSTASDRDSGGSPRSGNANGNYFSNGSMTDGGAAANGGSGFGQPGMVQSSASLPAALPGRLGGGRPGQVMGESSRTKGPSRLASRLSVGSVRSATDGDSDSNLPSKRSDEDRSPRSTMLARGSTDTVRMPFAVPSAAASVFDSGETNDGMKTVTYPRSQAGSPLTSPTSPSPASALIVKTRRSPTRSIERAIDPFGHTTLESFDSGGPSGSRSPTARTRLAIQSGPNVITSGPNAVAGTSPKPSVRWSDSLDSDDMQRGTASTGSSARSSGAAKRVSPNAHHQVSRLADYGTQQGHDVMTAGRSGPGFAASDPSQGVPPAARLLNPMLKTADKSSEPQKVLLQQLAQRALANGSMNSAFASNSSSSPMQGGSALQGKTGANGAIDTPDEDNNRDGDETDGLSNRSSSDGGGDDRISPGGQRTAFGSVLHVNTMSPGKAFGSGAFNTTAFNTPSSSARTTRETDEQVLVRPSRLSSLQHQSQPQMVQATGSVQAPETTAASSSAPALTAGRPTMNDAPSPQWGAAESPFGGVNWSDSEDGDVARPGGNAGADDEEGDGQEGQESVAYPGGEPKTSTTSSSSSEGRPAGGVDKTGLGSSSTKQRPSFERRARTVDFNAFANPFHAASMSQYESEITREPARRSSSQLRSGAVTSGSESRGNAGAERSSNSSGHNKVNGTANNNNNQNNNSIYSSADPNNKPKKQQLFEQDRPTAAPPRSSSTAFLQTLRDHQSQKGRDNYFRLNAPRHTMHGAPQQFRNEMRDLPAPPPLIAYTPRALPPRPAGGMSPAQWPRRMTISGFGTFGRSSSNFGAAASVAAQGFPLQNPAPHQLPSPPHYSTQTHHGSLYDAYMPAQQGYMDPSMHSMHYMESAFANEKPQQQLIQQINSESIRPSQQQYAVSPLHQQQQQQGAGSGPRRRPPQRSTSSGMILTARAPISQPPQQMTPPPSMHNQQNSGMPLYYNDPSGGMDDMHYMQYMGHDDLAYPSGGIPMNPISSPMGSMMSLVGGNAMFNPPPMVYGDASYGNELQHARTGNLSNSQIPDDMLQGDKGNEDDVVCEHDPVRGHVSLDVDLETEIELTSDEPLGKGAFGEVYAGLYLGTYMVAVKFAGTMASGFVNKEALETLHKEADILSRLKCPNIVTFYGGCFREDSKVFIVEELLQSDLSALIHNRNELLPLDDVLRIGRDIAAGLAYLHPNVVHRDLKPANVLLDHKGVAKISDFGMARFKHYNQHCTKNNDDGTRAYMAPECFDDKQVIDHRADMYSWAIIMWEMLTGHMPWYGMSSMQIMMAVHRGDRPEMPQPSDRCLAELLLLISECWQPDPKSRHTSHDVKKFITAMIKKRELAKSRSIGK